MIGVLLPNNRIRAIYCHWDGYPSYNGKILLDHYGRKEVEKLLELGDRSTLHDTPSKEGTYIDRGELPDLCGADDYLDDNNMKECHWDCDYFYLFGLDDIWYVSKNGFQDAWVRLDGVAGCGGTRPL